MWSVNIEFARNLDAANLNENDLITRAPLKQEAAAGEAALRFVIWRRWLQSAARQSVSNISLGQAGFDRTSRVERGRATRQRTQNSLHFSNQDLSRCVSAVAASTIAASAFASSGNPFAIHAA